MYRILTFLILITVQQLFGRETAIGENNRGPEKKFERAEQYYKGGNFHSALGVYLDLYRKDTLNMNLCYRIGDCYLKTGKDIKQSVYFLSRAAGSVSRSYREGDVTERNAPVITYKLLGDALHLDYRFDEALDAYYKFRQNSRRRSGPLPEEEKDAQYKILVCNYAKEIMACPAEVKIANMGKNLNSPYDDYSPRISADQSTMIFTSRRPENTGGKKYGEGLYFEDIYISHKINGVWQPAANIGETINTSGNEAAVAISADGQEILLYRDDMGDGNIYSSRLDGDEWTVPVKLNSNINSRWWEPAAYISADGNTLYFVSDRPGGFGGSDIYASTKTPGGDWGRAVNLGSVVNTAYDEHSPFIHPDGKTLFFSSKGHKTMGGYDVFFSRMQKEGDNKWSEPENVGYPVNTTGDDAFYMVSADKQMAYYASNLGSAGSEKDLYSVTFVGVKEPPLALVKGIVGDSGSKMPREVVITITDNETSEVLAVYHTNKKTGKYSFILTPGRNHNISYEAEGYLPYSENRHVSEEKSFDETEIPVKLTEVSMGSKVVLNNIFFDFDRSELRPYSKSELDRIYRFLTKNPDLSVEISGFADSKGRDEYNKKLSLERARSVVNYLTGKGIAEARMSAAGYGSVASNAGESADGGRQYDRRVELKITGINNPNPATAR